MVDLASSLLSAENFPWFVALTLGMITVIVGLFAIIGYFVDSRKKYKMIELLLQHVEKGQNLEIEVGSIKIKSSAKQ